MLKVKGKDNKNGEWGKAWALDYWVNVEGTL